MRLLTLQALTWGTVAGSVACALWLAAINGDAPRNTLAPLAGLSLPADVGMSTEPQQPPQPAESR